MDWLVASIRAERNQVARRARQAAYKQKLAQSQAQRKQKQAQQATAAQAAATAAGGWGAAAGAGAGGGSGAGGASGGGSGGEAEMDVLERWLQVEDEPDDEFLRVRGGRAVDRREEGGCAWDKTATRNRPNLGRQKGKGRVDHVDTQTLQLTARPTRFFPCSLAHDAPHPPLPHTEAGGLQPGRVGPPHAPAPGVAVPDAARAARGAGAHPQRHTELHRQQPRHQVSERAGTAEGAEGCECSDDGSEGAVHFMVRASAAGWFYHIMPLCVL